MIISILILIAAFIILIKSADYFVSGASSLASHFKVSKMVIGLTIVAFGTSAPELAVSVQSLINGSGDLVLGNVIGSNIINILLILGISSLIVPISIKSNTIRKEIPICILVTILLSVLFFDISLSGSTQNMISRSDGIVILLFFAIFVYYLFSIMRNKTVDELPEENNTSLLKSILMTVAGIILIIISSDLVVNEAVNIAHVLNISERMISLTIIAFGTSLPELITSIVAAKKREQDILVGNIIGSNIFNICIVIGIPSALIGSIIPSGFSLIDFVIFILSAILLFIFARRKSAIKRYHGIAMLILFALYYTIIII